MNCKGTGMWMPKQKYGKNWELNFSVTLLNDGTSIVDRRKSFRVKADAAEWIREMKRLTIEAGMVQEPEFSNFTYTQIKEVTL